MCQVHFLIDNCPTDMIRHSLWSDQRRAMEGESELTAGGAIYELRIKYDASSRVRVLARHTAGRIIFATAGGSQTHRRAIRLALDCNVQ